MGGEGPRRGTCTRRHHTTAPPHQPAGPPLHTTGRDLLIVSRAAFAPWARSSDAPLNEYYNNHNSNTIAFHRWAGGGGGRGEARGRARQPGTGC